MRVPKTIFVDPGLYLKVKLSLLHRNLKIYDGFDVVLSEWLKEDIQAGVPPKMQLSVAKANSVAREAAELAKAYELDAKLRYSREDEAREAQTSHRRNWRAERRKRDKRLYPCCGRIARRLPRVLGEPVTRTCHDCGKKYIVKRVSTYVEEVGRRMIRYKWSALPDLPGRDAMGRREAQARLTTATYSTLAGSSVPLDPVYDEIIGGNGPEAAQERGKT